MARIPRIPNLEAIRDWCKNTFQPAGNYASAEDIPTKTSKLQNDSGYITEVRVDEKLEGYATKSEIAEGLQEITAEEALAILNE